MDKKVTSMIVGLVFLVSLVLSLNLVSAHWYCDTYDDTFPIDNYNRPVVDYSVVEEANGDFSLTINAEVCKGDKFSNLYDSVWGFGAQEIVCNADFPNGDCGVTVGIGRRCALHYWGEYSYHPVDFPEPSGEYSLDGSVSGLSLTEADDDSCISGTMFKVTREISMNEVEFDNLEGFSVGVKAYYGRGNIKTFPSKYVVLTKPDPEPYCGDGVCGGDESCSTCPEDCGICPEPECVEDIDCGENYYSDNYCTGDDIYRDLHEFSCEGEDGCVERIIPELVQTCADVCVDGECSGVTCYSDSDCAGSSWNPFCKENDIWGILGNSECVNGGAINSYCEFSFEELFDTDCGENSVGVWDYYCVGDDVYRSRETYSRGCVENGEVLCFNNQALQEELYEECDSDEECKNGDCEKEDCDKSVKKTQTWQTEEPIIFGKIADNRVLTANAVIDLISEDKTSSQSKGIFEYWGFAVLLLVLILILIILLVYAGLNRA